MLHLLIRGVNDSNSLKISVYMMKFPICFLTSVAVEFGQKYDKQICSEEAHSAHKNENNWFPTYSDRPALSLEELMSQASMSAGFLGHEAKEEEKLRD